MSEATRPLRVAVIGAGPAGIYAADLITKSEEVRSGAVEVSIDIFDRYPAPFGLIRYGVAPDHPRIKGIITALHKVLDRGDIRFFGNVEYGKDLNLADLREHYDAIIFATGAIYDAPLPIEGIDLDGSYGAADFVSWYDGHPDYPRTWPLNAKEIAVLGNGNVALDIARVLSKHADDLLVTEEDFEFDEASDEAIQTNNQVKTMMKTLTTWLTDQEEGEQTASRRLHLHFLQSPHEILGEDGKVVGIRMERNKLDGKGGIEGTGEFVDYPVQAVYRAIGYFGSELPEVGYDADKGVITNVEGRVVDENGEHVPDLYATGWIKRGPVGLIGSTKGDALETITHLLEDRENLYTAAEPDADTFSDYLDSKGIRYTTWEGWHRLDDHEKALGAASQDAKGEPRERVKVVDRDEMIRISRGE